MLFSLFINFFKIGLFTFGGGYAMIAQIREEVVAKRNWLTEDELIEVIAIAESTPGPLAINLATFVGYKQRGIRGSLAATRTCPRCLYPIRYYYICHFSVF